MKKTFLRLSSIILPANQASLNTGNGNANLNSFGSGYAQQFGHQATSLMRRVVREIIFDATPLQYLDLKIMSMTPAEKVDSDEFFYQETTFGRDPIIATGLLVDIAAGSQQVIPIQSMDTVSKDMIVVYPDNTKATVIDLGANTMTVKAMTGQILPALAAATYGVAGSLIFANLAPVESDARSNISQYYRMNTIERSNYVQMLVMAQRWGEMELAKYVNAGTLSNFIETNKEHMYRQFRVSLSNAWWNGEMGEVTLADGSKAKTHGGVIPIMNQVGSPSYNVTLANAPTAFETMVLDTEFGEYGRTRFAYATPSLIHWFTGQYKSELTRYQPTDDWAHLNLSGIDIGSSKIVFVPVQRFQDRSCFPASFQNQLILLDQENIKPCYLLPERKGDTLARVNNGTLNNFTDTWVAATQSLKFFNPLACGKMTITNLPS